jgi:lipopolysaccharide export system protein LptA
MQQQDSCPMKFSLFLPLLALLLWHSGPVRAERADRLKPMQIEADRMQHDDSRQLTILVGHVQAIKGTLVMRAAHMEVQQDAQGQQVAHFRAEAGQRVFFRQKREGVNEFIEGESEQAVYDSQQDLMTLTGRAEVRILRQNQANDQIFGHHIVYNNTTEVMNVDERQQGKGRARARAILAPRGDAVQADTPLPALQGSSQLPAQGRP